MSCVTFDKNYVEDNIESTYGVDWTDTYETQDSNSTAIDITDYTFNLVIKEARENTAELISQAGSIVNATAGTFSLALTDTQIGTLTRGESYYYQIEITNPSNVELVYVRGQIKFT